MSIFKTLNHLYSNSCNVWSFQGSVFGSILFILYTTPFSTVISNLAANYHLYADDTQLLLSFSALDFSHNITHLVENTVTNVSN